MRRAQKFINWGVSISILAVFVHLFFDHALLMERVPTPAEIQKSSVGSQFLIEADDIRGIYQNLDIDCVIFSYSTWVQSEDLFWRKLDESLKATSWREGEPIGDIHRFERRFAKGKGKGERTGMASFSSAEETRVFYKNGKVFVAWVQADSWKEETSFVETGEAKFADRVVWPKFQALIK